jgi:hypothetical protein
MNMLKKGFAIVLLVLLSMVILRAVQASSITSCTFDKSVYRQGDTGYIAVTIYNDEDDKIRVTEITAAIDYFFDDATPYVQTFFTNATLPTEIRRGQSSTLFVLISLPTNVAPGYIEVHVRVKTDLWNTQDDRWYASDQPSDTPVLHVESPYKQQFQTQQAINQQLQGQMNDMQKQLLEVQTVNNNVTLIMYILVAVTALFGLLMVFLVVASRRAKAISEPVP